MELIILKRDFQFLRSLAFLVSIGVIVASASAQDYHYVRPHYNGDGTFVPGHYQTNADGNRYSNWSTKGNYNPFTGREGTVVPSVASRHASSGGAALVITSRLLTKLSLFYETLAALSRQG